MAQGTITHIEIPADDPKRAMRFYEAVAGWRFEQLEGSDDYWLFRTGDAAGGAIGRRGRSVGDVVRDYINVDSLDDTLPKVEANGGTILVGRTDIGMGWYAAVRDPEGNEIGLFEARPQG